MSGLATFSGGLKVQQIITATDGTRKILSTLEGQDGGDVVETVIIQLYLDLYLSHSEAVR